MGSDLLRIESLKVRNFRCFERFETSFHPEFTLLVGRNGSGKTAVMEAASTALSVLLPAGSFPGRVSDYRVDVILGDQRRQIIAKHGDVSTVERPSPNELDGVAHFEGFPHRWLISLQNGFSPLENDLAEWGAELARKASSGESVALPLVVCYPTSRLWHDIKADPTDEEPTSRLVAYDGALTAPSTYSGLVTWMRRQTYAGLQRRRLSPLLNAVQAAVCDALDDVAGFEYDVELEAPTVTMKTGERLPFRLHSDGYRNTIALIADLAYRAAVLNPQDGADAPKRAQGVVLIDEIDLHLHPHWQRRVISDLRRTFPNLQFVATTHSPQVLASAQRDWIRLLNGGPEAVAAGEVEGRDSNAILEEVMGEPSRPQVYQDRLNNLFQAIDARRYDEARQVLASLEAVWPADDPTLTRARWLLQADGEE